MKLECMKHGETEGVRQENGRLACEKCLAEKAEQVAYQAKKERDKSTSDFSKKLVEELFNGRNPFGDLFGGLR
jgi:hypothetical protein